MSILDVVCIMLGINYLFLFSLYIKIIATNYLLFDIMVPLFSSPIVSGEVIIASFPVFSAKIIADLTFGAILPSAK